MWRKTRKNLRELVKVEGKRVGGGIQLKGGGI
jgi:hypothetical protein